MFWMFVSLFLWSAAGGSSASAGRPPGAVTVRFPDFEYKQKTKSLENIGFANFTYHLDGTSVRLRRGYLHKRSDQGGVIEASLERVRFIRNITGIPAWAVVSITYLQIEGSSSNTRFLQVFNLKDGHPHVSQELSYDLQAPKTGDSLNRKARTLTITARARDGSPHCCPQHIEIDRFSWVGKKFKLISKKLKRLPA